MKKAIDSSVAVFAILLVTLFLAATTASAQVGVGVNSSSGVNVGAGSSASASAEAEGEMVVCTMDAYQCPDGTWVGRTGPDCEFICPSDGDRPTSSNDSMPVEPDGGIGDGALPLDDILIAEIMAESAVSSEVATEIVKAKAENENIVDISVSDDEYGEAGEIEVVYNTTAKILGIFDYPVSAVAVADVNGQVKTSYPNTPWYISLFLRNQVKAAMETVAINLSAMIKGSISSE